MNPRKTLPPILIVVGTALLATQAAADLKLVAQLDVSNPDGLSGTPAAGTVTLFIHGGLIRVENPDGTVRLFDLDKGRVESLELTAKTYTQESHRDYLDQNVEPPQDLRGHLSYSAALGLTPSTEPTNRFQGLATTTYELSGTLSLQRSENGGGMGGGRRGGFGGGMHGGFGGMGGGSGGGRRSGGGLPKAAPFSGELTTILSGDLVAKGKGFAAPLLSAALFGSPVYHKLSDTLDKAKLAPVFMSVDLPVSPNFRPTSGDADASSTPRPAHVTLTVKSLETVADDPGRFVPPSDFQKVPVPKPLSS